MRSFVILTAFTNIADWNNLCCQCALYWGKLIIKKICLLYLLVWLILDCQLSWEIFPLYQTVLVSPNQDLEEGLFVIPLLLPLSSYSGSQLIVGMKGTGQPWGFSEQVILHKFTNLISWSNTCFQNMGFPSTIMFEFNQLFAVGFHAGLQEDETETQHLIASFKKMETFPVNLFRV